MPELEIVLEYEGPDVEDGSMSIEDLVPVLQGFAGAYGKVAGATGVATQHKLRLTAIRQGSAELVLDVWRMVGNNASELQAVGGIVAAAMAVVGTIIAVIQLKKHVKNEPHEARIASKGLDGSINVINSQNVSLSVPVNVYTIFKEKLIDSDLSRVARPLETGRIESSSITIRAPETPILSERITASEKLLFEVTTTTVTSTRETWLTGRINSMVKSTNSGHIHLTDGTRVHFQIKAERPEQYYHLFGHNGLVKIKCVAHMDENLRPTELVVSEMIALQPLPRRHTWPLHLPEVQG